MWEGKRDTDFLHVEQKTVMTQNCAERHDSEYRVKCELAREVLRSFGTLRLEVTGLSMLPSVWPGDILFIERCGMPDIAAGHVIVFVRQGKLVTHRVVCMKDAGKVPYAITRGDGLSSSDDPVSPAELLGRVRHILRGGEFVRPGESLNFWVKATSYILRHFVCAARVLVIVHRLKSDIWRQESLCKN